MAYEVKIKVSSCKLQVNNTTTRDLALPKLIYSTSSILGTSGSGQNETEITLSCDNATKCKVGYLKEPGQNGKRFKNSLAISLSYQNDNNAVVAMQEVIVCAAPGKIKTVTWETNGTAFDQDDGDVDYSTDITVSILYSSLTQNEHNPITDLTLFGYYISGKGYRTSSGISTATTLGSRDKPSRAFNRKSSNKWTTSETNDLDESVSSDKYSLSDGWYTLDDSVYPRAFTFEPQGTPSYYIIIAFKIYASGIGHIQVLSGTTNNFKDESDYWNEGWKNYPGTSIKTGLRYTVCSVYTDGIVPALGPNEDGTDVGEYIRGNYGTNSSYRGIAYPYAQNVWFNYPPSLVSISWYNYNNGSPVLLKDGTGIQDLIYSIKKDDKPVAITIPDVKNQINFLEKSIKGWYVGTSPSSWSTGDANLKDKSYFTSVTPDSDLFFAFVFEDRLYDITYQGETQVIKTVQLKYNNTLNINPIGNIGSGVAVSHQNPKTEEIQIAAYSINPIDDDYQVANPTTTGNWVFKYWNKTVSGSTTILTAVWEIGNITITYNKNGGSGSMSPSSDTISFKDAEYKIRSNEFTPPAGQYFINWKDGDDRTYTPNRNYKNYYTKNLTLYAQWGTPWRKVKTIWIYSDTQISGRTDGKQQGNGYWYPYKIWVQTK